MDRDEAREAVVAAFDELGLLDKVETTTTCYDVPPRLRAPRRGPCR